MGKLMGTACKIVTISSDEFHGDNDHDHDDDSLLSVSSGNKRARRMTEIATGGFTSRPPFPHHQHLAQQHEDEGHVRMDEKKLVRRRHHHSWTAATNRNRVHHFLLEMKRVTNGKKLYGRQEEKQILVDAWERCCCSSRCSLSPFLELPRGGRGGSCRREEEGGLELVVVSGSPGSGKSALVNSLRPLVKQTTSAILPPAKKNIIQEEEKEKEELLNTKRGGGFFLSGKFPEYSYQRKASLEVFVVAFTSYVHQLMDSRDEALIWECQQKLNQDLTKAEWTALIQLVPAFHQLLFPSSYKKGETSTIDGGGGGGGGGSNCSSSRSGQSSNRSNKNTKKNSSHHGNKNHNHRRRMMMRGGAAQKGARTTRTSPNATASQHTRNNSTAVSGGRCCHYLPPSSDDTTSSTAAGDLESLRLYGYESGSRLKRAFSKALSVICSLTPILLFLDDAQWADATSLDLLQSLLTFPTTVGDEDSNAAAGGQNSNNNHSHCPPHLLVVVAIRGASGEEGKEGKNNTQRYTGHTMLQSVLKQLDQRQKQQRLQEQHGSFIRPIGMLATRVTSVQLSDISKQCIEELVQDTFRLGCLLSSFDSSHDSQTVSSLSQVVHAQTRGNLFFIFQFLRHLVSDGLIWADPRTGWNWDDQAILSKFQHHDNEQQGTGTTSTRNSLDLVRRCILSLPQPVQKVLKIASCLGVDIDCSAIDLVLGSSQTTNNRSAAELLQEAANEGLVVFSPQYGGFRFAHDWTRHAAFSLIPQAKRQSFYWHLGCSLWKHSSRMAFEDNITQVVSLINKGLPPEALNESERYIVAELNLKAGMKAYSIPMFHDASVFFKRGVSLLTHGGQRDDDCWKARYELTLQLHSYYVESCVYSEMDIDAVATCVDKVLEQARSLDDKLQVYVALPKFLEQQQHWQESMSVCAHIVNELGESFPSSNPSKLCATKELLKVRLCLRGKSDRFLSSLPRMTDVRKINCMRFLGMGCMVSFRAKSPRHFVLFVCRSILLSLRQGFHGFTAIAYAAYGAVLCGFGNTKEGLRFGQLATRLAEVENDPVYNTWVQFIRGSCIDHWSEPIQKSLDALTYSRRLTSEVGYVGLSLLNRQLGNWIVLAAGTRNLSAVETEAKELFQMAAFHSHASVERPAATFLLIIQCHIGNTTGNDDDDDETPPPLRFSRNDVANDMRHNTRVMLQTIGDADWGLRLLCFIFSMELAYMYGCLEQAKTLAELYLEHQQSPTPMFPTSFCSGTMALIGIALYRKGIDPYENKKWARKHMNRFAARAEASPSNYLALKLLIDAEWASSVAPPGSSSSSDDADQLYRSAFLVAKQQGSLKYMALILERRGDSLLEAATTRMRARTNSTPTRTPSQQQQNLGTAAAVQWSKAADIYETWGALGKCAMLQTRVGLQRGRKSSRDANNPHLRG